jgi:putative ABC transport system permease protein
MFQNYLKITWRNLLRNKSISFINIFGLALGMAVVLLIALFVRNEFSYDQFIENKEHVYRVSRYWSQSNGHTVWTPSRMAEKMKAEFPEVILSSGLSPAGEQLMEYRGDKHYVEETARVDSTFFLTVALPFLYGDPATALEHPNSLVISDRLAKRLFGAANPIGETVRLDGEKDMLLTGVVALDGKRTHADYDAFARFTFYSDSWTGNNRATYLRLQPGTDVAALEAKITTVMQDLIKQEHAVKQYTPKADELADWRLQPLTDIHLRSGNFSWVPLKEGNIRNVYIFLLIAGLILTVAIVNYVNLATAQATKRAKEVGVRKATGALRSQLTGQFMTEALCQAVVAALLAAVLAEVLLPFFNTVTDRQLALLQGNLLWALTPLAGLALLTGLLAGFYPALVLSGFQPVKALKTNFLKTSGSGNFRKVLVTGQFTVTIALLVVMAFVYKQVSFMLKHELGFQPDQVLVIPHNLDESFRKVEALKPDFLTIPGVKSVATSNRVPGQGMPDWGLLIEGRDEYVYPHTLFADPDYAKTLGIELAQGRFLSHNIAGDTVDNFVVNETFVQRNNLENPIGVKLKFTNDEQFGQIVGVVKDFHFRGMDKKMTPLFITGRREQRYYTMLQLSTANLASTVFEIEKRWKLIEPEHPLRYSFLDEDFASLYAEQERFGKTMLYATVLTLFIAILGLLGLTAFNVERRTKEIGIRKVLGASVAGIVGLLSKDFLVLVLLAILLAAPIGWYATILWLEDFPFQTDVAWWVFALAGGVALLVAFAAMAFQSTKAALANPVESLRSE